MKKLVHITILIAVQHLAINMQNATAQAINDNIGAGNCLDFDGTNDFVEINPTSDFDFGIGNFTISFWCTYNGPNEYRVALARMNHCGAGQGFMIQFTDAGTMYAQIGSRALGSTTSVYDGKWHHIAMVRNAGTMSIYIDGVNEGTRNDVAGQIATAHNNPNLHIGAHNPYFDPGVPGCNSGVSRYWDGDIDEVRIWNIGMSESQIRDSMCQPVSNSESGLVSYWNMNEGTGNTVNDITTNANHGTRQ